MTPEVKAKWVAALRSGKYPQTRGLLNRRADGEDPEGYAVGPGYCCLGVLCEVGVKDGLIERIPGEGSTGYRWLSGFPDYWVEATLGTEMLTWAGLTDGEQMYLADKNDAGASFAEIAGYIEAEL